MSAQHTPVARYADLLAALQECAEYLDRYADVIDGEVDRGGGGGTSPCLGAAAG